MRKLALTAAVLAVLLPLPSRTQTTPDQPLSIVAAENFYGDAARQIAGPEARVTSILSNPDQDPPAGNRSCCARSRGACIAG